MSDSERGRRRGTERRRMTEMVAVRRASAEKKSLEEAAARMGVSIARLVRESITGHIGQHVLAIGDVKAPPDQAAEAAALDTAIRVARRAD
jgi:hypothetical protein